MKKTQETLQLKDTQKAAMLYIAFELRCPFGKRA